MFEIRKTNGKTTRAEKTKYMYCAIKLSQIRQRIEVCLREIIRGFEMNLQNLLTSEVTGVISLRSVG
jgi:hypothetical protein